MSRRVAVDFDGVLHSWDGEWQGADVVNGAPIPGAIDWLEQVLNSGLDVVILTSRCAEDAPDVIGRAREAIRFWLVEHGLPQEKLRQITITAEKLAAGMYIDDRGFHFEGQFPTPAQILNFKPWWRR